MTTIHKFPLETTDYQNIYLTHGAKVLCVQVQNGIPCVWVLLDTEEHPVVATVRTYGTGHTIDENTPEESYVGTYQLENGALVFHVFIN